MGPRGKMIVTVLLIGVVAGAYTLQTNNSALFQGQLELEDGETGPTPAAGPADLTASLEVLPPLEGKTDLRASATVSNLGQGAVTAGQPFTYTIYINDQEVFSNTDSYSTVEPGDSFNFVYPIPRNIYQYPDEGTVRFTVDTTNSIEESNENNNTASADYSLLTSR